MRGCNTPQWDLRGVRVPKTFRIHMCMFLRFLILSSFPCAGRGQDLFGEGCAHMRGRWKDGSYIFSALSRSPCVGPRIILYRTVARSAGPRSDRKMGSVESAAQR